MWQTSIDYKLIQRGKTKECSPLVNTTEDHKQVQTNKGN